MHRFCVPGGYSTGEVIDFPAEEAAHALKVLRLEAGDEVEISDGVGRRFSAVLDEVSKGRVTAKLVAALDAHESPVRITLYQGYPKADKLDFIVQKATELGAVRIVPVVMRRCVAKPDGKDGPKKKERLTRIALEASKQCGRACVPEVALPMTWKQAMADFEKNELKIIPWEDAQGRNLNALHAEQPEAAQIGILIGPEGGISEEEAREAEALGGRLVTLGGRILRTETAALTSIAVAMSLWGDI